MPIPGPPITSGSMVQFVDSIASSPTVRLDLNDGVSFITLREGTSFNPPPLNQPTSAMAGVFDGAPPSASSYGNRVVELKLRLKGVDEDAVSNLIRSLMVELNRNTNILKLQVASTPVFFRTYRTSADDVDFGDFGLGECNVTIPILAEPFGYGLRVDQAGVSVKSNPALTNGCYLDVNGVTGDVATPAYVVLSSQTGSTVVGAAAYLSVRRHGTPANLPFVFQAEAASLGTDTAVAGSTDATASGAGNNYALTTFVTTTLTNRLTVLASLANQTEIRGTFKVLARVQKTVGADTITMSAGATTNRPATLAAGTAWQMVDLGLVQIPPGEDGPEGYSGVYTDLDTTFGVPIYAARSAGSGNLKTDYVLLLPADENLVAFTGAGWGIGFSLVLDGPNDNLHTLHSAHFSNSSATRAGSIPLLQPGSNRLFFVENTAMSVGDSSTVTVSYWPRVLVV